MTEKEAFFVLTFNSRPEGSDKICVELNYFDLVELETADANGIIKAITKSFNEVNINYLDKLVGFGSVGASVNREDKDEIKTIIQRENEWLSYGWYVAHRLELALKDALKGTAIDDTDGLLLRLYYLYKKFPKKLRQMKQLRDLYEESTFSEAGYRPKKSSGIFFKKKKKITTSI